MKYVTLTLSPGLGNDLGPNFNLTTNVGVVEPSTATKAELTAGKIVVVDDTANQITITSIGVCTNSISQIIDCSTQTTLYVDDNTNDPVYVGVIDNTNDYIIYSGETQTNIPTNEVLAGFIDDSGTFTIEIQNLGGFLINYQLFVDLIRIYGPGPGPDEIYGNGEVVIGYAPKGSIRILLSAIDCILFSNDTGGTLVNIEARNCDGTTSEVSVIPGGTICAISVSGGGSSSLTNNGNCY